MNGRILDLAKNPELFQIQDLELLNNEINKHPYIQSLRALHLLGTHRLKPENYANELSITAAYTTDKKILYQFINAVKESKSPVEVVEESKTKSEVAQEGITEKEVLPEEPKNKFTEIESKEIETPKPVFVKGELNRILFEGEEDFLEREVETIDLESTIEAGQIVTQKVDLAINLTEQPIFGEAKDAETFSKEKIVEEKIVSEEKSLIENPAELSFQETTEFLPDVKMDNEVENSEDQELLKFTESTDAENFSKETIIKEAIIPKEKPLLEDTSKLSFHGLDEFLPEVKIGANPEKNEVKVATKPTQNKHEEEMKRLIAEVEAKMKASKKPKVIEVEEVSKSAEVNFAETQSFDLPKVEDEKTPSAEQKPIAEEKTFVKEEPAIIEKLEEQQQKAVEIPKESIETKPVSIPENKPEWKPMSFFAHTPDALISKKTEEVPVNKEAVKTEEIVINKQEKTDTVIEEKEVTERPVFNASFFTQNVSALSKDRKKEETQPIIEEEKTVENLDDSNIPDFINTWQSWLKIDRNKQDGKEKIEISITEIKNKVIENFIEKEPRISKLKEESDFVIKERNDDISHLMTETLANLYTEQKLYAKAIKSYAILTEKHPEKKDHFDDKIKQIKELRQNK